MTGNTLNKFTLRVLSPTKTLFNQQVVLAVIPACEGEFGVLVNHAPFVTIVKTGEIKIYLDDLNIIDKQIKITDGFVSIKDNICQVLVNDLT